MFFFSNIQHFLGQNKAVLLGTTVGLILGFSGTAQAASGDLNTGFSSDGMATVAFNLSSAARALAIQADGKIVVAGETTGTGSVYFDFAVARYNANGSLDIDFDTDGKVVAPIGAGNDYGEAIAIQPNGKILVAGIGRNSSNFDFALMRFNADGSLDTSFSTDGKVITSIGAANDEAYAIALQPDGKILLAGTSDSGSSTGFDFALVRYNSDGSLDTGFSTDGILTTSFTNNTDVGLALSIQPNGSILVAGRSNNGSNDDFAMAKYNSFGVLISSFGSNGKVVRDFGVGSDEIYAITMLPDGKILVAGDSANGLDLDITLARYDVSGDIDTTFGANGTTLTDTGQDDIVSAMALQPDDKIVVAGASNINGDIDFILARYSYDGVLDTSFGSNGIVTTDINAASADDNAYALAINPSGTILLAGKSGTNAFGLANYLANDEDNNNATEAWDITPDTFSYTDEADVTASSLQTSENITISGLGANITVPVVVSGGEYALNGSTSYTRYISYVTNGDTINVRHTASSTGSITTNTTLTVGGMHAPNNMAFILGNTTADTYSSTTVAAPAAASGGGGSLNLFWLAIFGLLGGWNRTCGIRVGLPHLH